MKNIILILVVFIIVFSLSMLEHCTKERNVYTFPKSLVVENYTNYKSIDTTVMIITNKIFHMDSLQVKIYYMPEDPSSEEFKVYAFIQKNPFINHSYFIFMSENIDISMNRLFAHELTHLKQMECGDLIQTYKDYAIYKQDTIYFSKVDYDNRAYENDAFGNENEILNELRKLNYTK